MLQEFLHLLRITSRYSQRPLSFIEEIIFLLWLSSSREDLLRIEPNILNSGSILILHKWICKAHVSSSFGVHSLLSHFIPIHLFLLSEWDVTRSVDLLTCPHSQVVKMWPNSGHFSLAPCVWLYEEQLSMARLLLLITVRYRSSTGYSICSYTWIVLTLIWVFHRLAQQPSHFSQIPISPGRIWQTVENSKFK